MALDPGAAAFLKYKASQDIPDVKAFHVEVRKAGHGDKDISGPIETTVAIEHRFITSPTADLPIRIYRPAEDQKVRNCLVFFHGGGWVVGTIDRYDAQLSQLAKRLDAVVVSVNYQKSPENGFPIPFDDCYSTLEWVIENDQELLIDLNKVGVAGDSAGGNLAAAVALKARDAGMINLAYQVLLYPCLSLDFETASYRDYSEGFGLTRENMIWFWNAYIDITKDALNPYAVPASAKTLEGLAPAIIVTAEFDPLTDDSRRYMERLKEAGVEFSYRHFEGMIHGIFNQHKFVTQTATLIDYLVSEIKLRIRG